jgi:hypothetical protein
VGSEQWAVGSEQWAVGTAVIPPIGLLGQQLQSDLRHAPACSGMLRHAPACSGRLEAEGFGPRPIFGEEVGHDENVGLLEGSLNQATGFKMTAVPI